jgi:hypothetical protein
MPVACLLGIREICVERRSIMAAAWQPGRNGKAYFGAALAALADMVEMSNVKDVTMNLDAAEGDVTTRANGLWAAVATGHLKCSVDFEMIWDPDDVGFAAIKAAFLASAPLELAFLTAGKAVSKSEGPKGSFVVTKFNRKEPLQGEIAITVDVTVKPSAMDSWVVVA